MSAISIRFGEGYGGTIGWTWVVWHKARAWHGGRASLNNKLPPSRFFSLLIIFNILVFLASQL